MKKVKPNFKTPKPRYFFREWRKHRGLTQEDLAERVGVSPASISQLERGLQGFTDSTLEGLATALNCGPGDLLMRNPLDEQAPWSIMENLQKATPEERLKIVEYSHFVLKTGTGG